MGEARDWTLAILNSWYLSRSSKAESLVNVLMKWRRVRLNLRTVWLSIGQPWSRTLSLDRRGLCGVVVMVGMVSEHQM